MRNFVLLCVVMLLGCQGSAPGIKSIQDEALTSNLYDALISQFWEERVRLTSKPPTGNDNAVFDLEAELVESPTGDVVVDDLRHVRNSAAPSTDGAGVPPVSYSLVWSYRNTGDYDWDGEVAIADIAQIVRFFGYVAPDDGPASYKLKADGNHNGEVGVSDITPIAYNYLSAVEGYVIQGATRDGEFVDIAQVTDTTLGVKVFHSWCKTIEWNAGSEQGYDLFRVIPVAGSQRGSPSNVAGAVWIQPHIISVLIGEGEIPVRVTVVNQWGEDSMLVHIIG